MYFSKNNLKQYSLIITAGNIIFLRKIIIFGRKIDDALFLLRENDPFLLLNKGWLFLF